MYYLCIGNTEVTKTLLVEKRKQLKKKYNEHYLNNSLCSNNAGIWTIYSWSLHPDQQRTLGLYEIRCHRLVQNHQDGYELLQQEEWFQDSL